MNRQTITDRAVSCAAVLVSATLAFQTYVQYLGVSRPLWTGIVHDRNGHYEYGLVMAAALRHGKLFDFFSQLEKGKVWPPLHGLLVAAVTLIGGFNYRIAVLPSLIGFFSTMIFGFLLARRLVPDRVGGLAAGTIALIFIAGSPAHRAFATDVMLESLGAGLTMLVLYRAVVAVQDPEVRRNWRVLAIALTLLFFTKYNYWAVAVLAFAISWTLSHRQQAATALAACVRTRVAPWLLRELRHPLVVVAGILIGVALVVSVHGPTTIEWHGFRASLYPPNNITTAAYTLVLVRIVAVATTRSLLVGLSPAQQELVRWHLAPVAISFVFPDRLAVFLWYLTSSHGAAGSMPVTALRYYGAALTHEYHASSLSALAAACLFAVAILRGRVLNKGALVVLVLSVLGAVLATLHPRIESRMVHSWIASLWVAGGAGLGSLLIGGTRSHRAGALRWAGAVASVVLIMVVAGPRTWGISASESAGQEHAGPQLLEITDTYLPYLAGAQSPAILSTVPCQPLLRWTFLERYPDRQVALPVWDMQLTRDDLRQRFDRWIASSPADVLVMVEVKPGSPFDVRLPYGLAASQRDLAGLMRSQSRFSEARHWDLHSHGVVISLWQHRPEFSSSTP